jgi:uncharacterized membrane protein
MGMLLLGLVLFLACHSVRVFAEGWRVATRLRLGEKMYKALYSLTSIVGFVLIVYGFGVVRMDSPMLWLPPVAMRHVASLLMLFSMILLVAAYVPHNAIKDRLRHPMVLSVKVWALAHLLSNGRLADLMLFGAFLVWAVLNFRASRQRDRQAAASLADTNLAAQPSASTSDAAADLALPSVNHNARVILIGVGAWLVLLFGGHTWLFGVSPIGY